MKVGAKVAFKRKTRRSRFKSRKMVILRKPELKYNDTSVTQVNPTGTGSINVVSSLAQGTDLNTRIGDKITLKSIYMHWSCFQPNASTSNIVRFILFHDSNCQGALPAVGDVLASANVNSHLNSLNQSRFRVIWDKKFSLNTTDNIEVVRHSYKKMNKTLNYIGNGAAVSSCGKNTIFILMISDYVGATPPQFTYNIRERFIDY